MKKRKLVLAGLSLAGLLAVASCGEKKPEEKPDKDQEEVLVDESPLLKDEQIPGDNGVIETIYGAPNGKNVENGGDGSLENPFDFYSALSRAGAGDTVYLRGGVYNTPDRVTLTANGNAKEYSGMV
jgi:hypothetical protein